MKKALMYAKLLYPEYAKDYVLDKEASILSGTIASDGLDLKVVCRKV